MMLTEQTSIKSAQPKNYPALDTFSLTMLPTNSEQANGSTNSVTD